MKNTATIALLLVLFVLGVSLIWFFFFSGSAREDRIKTAIAEANYCETAADCQMAAQSACPFGCYIYVNKNEAARIGALIAGYESRCAYSCVQFQGVECINKTCQVVQ